LESPVFLRACCLHFDPERRGRKRPIRRLIRPRHYRPVAVIFQYHGVDVTHRAHPLFADSGANLVCADAVVAKPVLQKLTIPENHLRRLPNGMMEDEPAGLKPPSQLLKGDERDKRGESLADRHIAGENYVRYDRAERYRDDDVVSRHFRKCLRPREPQQGDDQEEDDNRNYYDPPDVVPRMEKHEPTNCNRRAHNIVRSHFAVAWTIAVVYSMHLRG
jgi:hypothetical protein